MVDTLRKFVGFLILASLALNLVSCQPNVPATQVATETPPDQLVTTTVDQPVGAETPLATPSSPKERIELAERWHRLDTTGGGGQTAIAPHPTNSDIVYMASDNGGLFKTENGGDTWFSVSSNMGAYRLGFVTLDPLNPEVVYVAASTDHGSTTSGGATGEIYRSLNGGLSWEFVSGAMGFQGSFPNSASIVIPYDPAEPGRFDYDGDRLSDVIVVGAWTGPADPPVGGIWRSEDEGRTFTHLALKDKNITALRAFAGDVNVLFVTTHEGQIYRSEDLGESWVDITGNMPLAHLSDLAVHPTNKDILYVTCRWCQAGEPPVWKTTDGDQHWEAASAGLDSNKIHGFPKILIDRFDAHTLYLTTDHAPKDLGGVYKSTDGGGSWHLMPARLVLPDGRPYHYYQFEGKFAIGQAIDGRLFDGGSAGWRYPDGDLTDGREEWEPATLGIGNVRVNDIEVDPFNPDVLYQALQDRGPYKSVDGGLSFHRIAGTGWPVTVDNFVWNGPYFSNYRKCQLDCSSTCEATGHASSGDTVDFAVSRQDSSIVYSAFMTGVTRGGVNKSTDGGATWQAVGFQLERGFELDPETCLPYGFRYLAIDPSNDEVLFAGQEVSTTRMGKLYRTTDGGATWSEVFAASGYIKGLEVSPLNPALVVLSTQHNVYKSEQGGEAGSWQRITPPDADGFRGVALSPHNEPVYVVGTNSQGFFYTADGGLSWTNNRLEGFFEQRLQQGSEQYLDPEIATATNPRANVLKNISAVVFDPVAPDTFYVAGTRHTRASFGVAKITHAGQNWERLPLAGLSHRNVFDLTIDWQGKFLYAGTKDGTCRIKLR